MQIENTKSCIISGSYQPRKNDKRPDDTHIDKNSRTDFSENASMEATAEVAEPQTLKTKKAFRLKFAPKELFSVIRNYRRRFLSVAAGTLVFAAGVGALSTYCTIGVNYYYGGKLLCTVAAADDAAAIIGSAAERAELLGVDEPQIETSAQIALKKDLIDGDEAVEKILAVSPYLCRGYVVSTGGIDLFVTADKATIDEVIDEYVEKYTLNDSAELSGDIEIREQIVRTDEITPTSYIPALLEEGNVLTVMNTVDLTEQTTVPYEVSEIEDDTMYVGDSTVETEGANGTLVTVSESVYSNATLISTNVISSEEKISPTTEVVRVGTKPRNALVDGLSYPLSGRLSSGFGERWGRMHRGIDLAVDEGTPVAAAAAGTVITAEYRESYGNFVQIDHGYGIVTSYAHLSDFGVSVGQKVNRGDWIAYSGNTGNSTGPHLHFEVIQNGEYLNPLDYLG